MAAPDPGEQPLSWQLWESSPGIKGTVQGDPNVGQLLVFDATALLSSVVDMGDAASKLLTVLRDKYGGLGSGNVTIRIRGAPTPFGQHDVVPSWVPYTGPTVQPWQYAQVKCEYAP